MIKLNSDTFRRAIEKAQTVAPACSLLDTDGAHHTFKVARSGGSFSIVDIWPEGGALWTSCDCAAGVGLHRRGNPQPCYHVAAEGEFWREATGTEEEPDEGEQMYGDPSSNAESMALRRAAAKFGLGLSLYEK